MANDNKSNLTGIAGVVAVVLGLVCLGLVGLVAKLAMGGGYGEGYKKYEDPNGKFTFEGPAAYKFEMTHTSEWGLEKYVHEAMGSGGIEDFFVFVCGNYATRFPGTLANDQIIQNATTEMYGVMEGQEISREMVERKSGSADRRIATGKQNGQAITLILEQYIDGDDLVVVAAVSTKPSITDDKVGQHYFESFVIKDPQERIPDEVDEEAEQPTEQPTMNDVLRGD